MHYLDIKLGEEYLYEGVIVTAIGTRVMTKASRARDDEYYVSILFRHGGNIQEVRPEALSTVPQDLSTWNASVERPIGFRRLPT